MLSEHYKRNFNEYGSLRAIGFKLHHIFAVNLIQTASIVICSIPVAVLAAYAVLKLYNLLLPYNGGGSGIYEYLSMLTYIPIANIVLVSVVLLIVALLGAFLICLLYHKLTIMDLVSGRTGFTISFVSKTSDRFEESDSVSIYGRLYMLRTRKSVILNVISSYGLHYISFMAILLTITAIIVLFMVEFYYINGRSREFSTIRAIGGSKAHIRKLAIDSSLITFALAIAAAWIFCIFVFSAMFSPEPMIITFIVLMAALILAVSSILILPISVSGALAALHSFSGKGIIKGIREKD